MRVQMKTKQIIELQMYFLRQNNFLLIFLTLKHYKIILKRLKIHKNNLIKIINRSCIS